MGLKQLGINYVEGVDKRLELVGVEQINANNIKVIFTDIISLDDFHNDKDLFDVSKVSHQVKLLNSKYQFKPNEINYSITSSEVFVQTIILPKMKKKEADESLIFELSMTYPNFAENYSFSIKTVQLEDNMVANYIAFCPFTLLKSLYGLGASLSLPVKNVTFNGNALYLLNKANNSINKDSNAIIINFNELNAVISVVVNGHCVSFQTIDVKINNIIDKMSSLNQIDLEQAKELIINGQVDELVLNQRQLDRVVQNNLSELVNALLLIIPRHQFNFERKEINNILVNIDSEIKDLVVNYIKDKLGIPCDIVDLTSRNISCNFLLAYAANMKSDTEDFKFGIVKQKVKFKQQAEPSKDGKEAKPEKKKSSFWTFRLK
jgi:Tfp pilus assembly PilM family ATPase